VWRNRNFNKRTAPKILKEYNKMKAVVTRVETIARTILSSSILRGLHMACRNVTHTKYGIWPSVAISSDYISPAHVDTILLDKAEYHCLALRSNGTATISLIVVHN
jgi:hypothetical protein